MNENVYLGKPFKKTLLQMRNSKVEWNTNVKTERKRKTENNKWIYLSFGILCKICFFYDYEKKAAEINL